MIVGDGVEKRYGRKRALKRCLVQRSASGLPARHRTERIGQDDAAPPRRGLAAATKGTLTIDAERGDLGYLGTSRCSTASSRRSRTSISSAASIACPSGASGRDAPRAVRPLGRSRRPRLDLFARHDAAPGALPRAAPRPGAARARRAVHRARRGRVGVARSRAHCTHGRADDRAPAPIRPVTSLATHRFALAWARSRSMPPTSSRWPARI